MKRLLVWLEHIERGIAVFVDRQLLVVKPVHPRNESAMLQRLADPVDSDRDERDQCHEGAEYDQSLGSSHEELSVRWYFTEESSRAHKC